MEKMKSLNRKIRSVWLLRNLIVFLVLLGICLIVCFSVGPEMRNLCFIVSGIFLFVCASLCIVFPFLRYRYYSYAYDDKRILIQCGVIFRHRVVIPICQIQDLHLFQGPLMILFDLHQVILSTAGSNFSIIGLDKGVAQTLVEDVQQYLGKRIEELKNESLQ